MRDLNNLNRKHDDKIKVTKCCKCPKDKEHIFCGCDCHKYQQQLESYRDEAYEYFSSVGICPCPEEIVDYVADCVEDESGCEVDDAGIKGIAKKLGITLD